MTWLLISWLIKKFKPLLKNHLLDAGKEIYLLYLSHNLIFLFQKDVRLNPHYLIMKIYNRGELQQIAINHSADIDYKDFMRIYRKCASEPYSFLTIDITLPTNNSLRFRENLLKMTLTDELKFLDDKIKQIKLSMI